MIFKLTIYINIDHNFQKIKDVFPWISYLKIFKKKSTIYYMMRGRYLHSMQPASIKRLLSVPSICNAKKTEILLRNDYNLHARKYRQ